MSELNIAVNGRKKKPNIPADGMKNGILAPARLKNGVRNSGVTPYSK
jgi:hypothetical protein